MPSRASPVVCINGILSIVTLEILVASIAGAEWHNKRCSSIQDSSYSPRQGPSLSDLVHSGCDEACGRFWQFRGAKGERQVEWGKREKGPRNKRLCRRALNGGGGGGRDKGIVIVDGDEQRV